jgi:hypothetical protein
MQFDFYNGYIYMGKHVAPLEHIILIASQAVFAFYLMLRA